MLFLASNALIENLKYLPIGNLYISAFPFVRTPSEYFFDNISNASSTPSKSLTSCLFLIKILKASSTILFLKLDGFTCANFFLKISFLSLLISHSITGSSSISSSLRLIKSLKSPHSTSPTFSSIHFLVSTSAFFIVGTLSQRVSSRSKVINLIFFIFLLLDGIGHKFLLNADNQVLCIFVLLIMSYDPKVPGLFLGLR